MTETAMTDEGNNEQPETATGSEPPTVEFYGSEHEEASRDDERTRTQRKITAALLRLVIADANRLADGVAKLLRVTEHNEADDGSHERTRIDNLGAYLGKSLTAAAKLLPLPTIAYREPLGRTPVSPHVGEPEPPRAVSDPASSVEVSHD